jgi:hypothetical protein
MVLYLPEWHYIYQNGIIFTKMALYLPEWRVKTSKMVFQELETGMGGEAPFQDVIQFYNI